MASSLDDFVDLVRAGAKASDVAAAAARAGKSLDEMFDAAKSAGKLNDAAVTAAKGKYVADVNKLGIKLPGVVDDAAGAARGADEAAGAAGAAKAAGNAAEASRLKKAINSTADYAKEAKKACTGNKAWCAGAVLGSAAAIYAADKYMKIKNYKGKITKIEPGEDGGLPIIGGGTKVAKVTYSEAVDILPTDTVTISGTNCSPSIDGDHTPHKIASKTEFWIKFDVGLTSPGSKGDFTITTGVVERLGEAVGRGAGAAGSAAGTAAGAAAGGAASGLGQGGSAFLKSFTGGAGMWITLILCCLCFAFIIFKFIL
jgi:hypothetical protein